MPILQPLSEPVRPGQPYCQKCDNPCGFTEQKALILYEENYWCTGCIDSDKKQKAKLARNLRLLEEFENEI